jgi:hypothetical protein
MVASLFVNIPETMKKLFALLCVLALTGCAADQQSRVTDAALTPLSDLNLTQAVIPPVLIEAEKQPYQMPADKTCLALYAQVNALEDVLDADFDAPPVPPGTDMERGSAALNDAAINAFRRTVEGAVPFRGWVRKLTGAERHSRLIARAIAAGTARRSFLKGVAMSRGCSVFYKPAAKG